MDELIDGVSQSQHCTPIRGRAQRHSLMGWPAGGTQWGDTQDSHGSSLGAGDSLLQPCMATASEMTTKRVDCNS